MRNSHPQLVEKHLKPGSFPPVPKNMPETIHGGVII